MINKNYEMDEESQEIVAGCFTLILLSSVAVVLLGGSLALCIYLIQLALGY